MRKLGTLLALGLMTALVACGGGDGSDTDAGTPLAGNGGGGFGGVGGFGGGGAGGGAGAGSCNYPSCLSGLATTCTPSGTCVAQTDLNTFATNVCYSNGVKAITAMNINAATGSMSMTVTYKNGSATCYSAEVGGFSLTGSTGNMTITFKNASGVAVATGVVDSTTNAVTVTCTGGQPITLDSSCDTGSYTSSATSDTSCTQGTCTP
jgi:hypothetical protein